MKIAHSPRNRSFSPPKLKIQNWNYPVANDGIDRRNFLSCMAWAGTGLLWTMAGGVPTSKLFAATGRERAGR
jgi:hypothetical protein